MPLFGIALSQDDSKKILISATSIADVLNTAKTKFTLPADKIFKIVLQDGGFEIQEDEVLLEYAKECIRHKKHPATLIVASCDESKIIGNIIEEVRTEKLTLPLQNIENTNEKVIDLNHYVWNKIPERLRLACEKKESTRPTDRLKMINLISDYMIDHLKDVGRKTAGKIASMICQKYPDSFNDKIEGQVLGTGIETLRAQIYNSVNYKKNRTKRSIKRILDSDDEDEELRIQEKRKCIKLDEYGCVAHAPLLPRNENSNTQEDKRVFLINLHNEVTSISDERISKYMEDTYATLRQLLNASNRDLYSVITDWPYLKYSTFIMQHASILLGKDVCKTWMDSLEIKEKSIRLFFSIKDHTKGKEEVFKTIIKNAKAAYKINNNKTGKILAIFPLLMTHFGEPIEKLFKVYDQDYEMESQNEVDNTMTPLLIIRGTSLFDDNSTCSVIIEGKINISCSNVLEGFLITFISYYVFGYKYPCQISKTLEFIQRLFLKIDPAEGHKRGSGAKLFEPAVLKLSEQLNDFANNFLI